MTTFADLTPQQRENARLHSMKLRETGQRQQVINLANKMLAANDQLTIVEFIAQLPANGIFLAEKSVRVYLSSFPFKKATRISGYQSRGKRVIEAYEKGYNTARFAVGFHHIMGACYQQKMLITR